MSIERGNITYTDYDPEANVTVNDDGDVVVPDREPETTHEFMYPEELAELRAQEAAARQQIEADALEGMMAAENIRVAREDIRQQLGGIAKKSFMRLQGEHATALRNGDPHRLARTQKGLSRLTLKNPGLLN